MPSSRPGRRPDAQRRWCTYAHRFGNASRTSSMSWTAIAGPSWSGVMSTTPGFPDDEGGRHVHVAGQGHSTAPGACVGRLIAVDPVAESAHVVVVRDGPPAEPARGPLHGVDRVPHRVADAAGHRADQGVPSAAGPVHQEVIGPPGEEVRLAGRELERRCCRVGSRPPRRPEPRRDGVGKGLLIGGRHVQRDEEFAVFAHGPILAGRVATTARTGGAARAHIAPPVRRSRQRLTRRSPPGRSCAPGTARRGGRAPPGRGGRRRHGPRTPTAPWCAGR